MTKIIVDLCQNHMGNRTILGDMIKIAATQGADYVKMQSIFAADLSFRDRFEEGKIDENGKTKTIKRPFQKEFDRLQKLDMNIDDHLFFIEECKKWNVMPLTTIFTKHRIAEIAKLPWSEKVVKVASYDCASYPFIDELMKYFDHLIISTGATFDDEIKQTAALVKGRGKKLTFLHCVTSYPNTLDIANLKRMVWLKNFVPQIGWSDHTLVNKDKIIATKTAIYLGADYVERHFTILPTEQTKDGPISITPKILKELSDFCRKSKEEQLKDIESEKLDWQIMLGEETRAMTETELLNRDYYRGRFAEKINDGVWKYNWEK